MYQILIKATPSSRFGIDEPERLHEPRLFGGFRSRTGRRARSLYGLAPEVRYANAHREPASWVTSEAAKRNADRLTERGYVVEVVEDLTEEQILGLVMGLDIAACEREGRHVASTRHTAAQCLFLEV